MAYYAIMKQKEKVPAGHDSYFSVVRENVDDFEAALQVQRALCGAKLIYQGEFETPTHTHFSTAIREIVTATNNAIRTRSFNKSAQKKLEARLKEVVQGSRQR